MNITAGTCPAMNREATLNFNQVNQAGQFYYYFGHTVVIHSHGTTKLSSRSNVADFRVSFLFPFKGNFNLVYPQLRNIDDG